MTDLNKTALSKQKVKIIVKNKKGKVVVNETVKTNSKGKAKLDLDLKKGKFTVNVTYAGNDNYTGNSTTQKLTIKEEVKKTSRISSYSNGYSSSSSNSYLAAKAEEEGIGYTYSDSGEVFIDEAAYAELGETW